MSPQCVSAVADVSMVLVTLFGFIFIYKQIRSASAEHLYSRMHDIHKIFLDNPEFRRCLYDPEPPSVEEYSDEHLIMGEMMADFFQQVFLELKHLPRTTAASWKCYMRDVLNNSPALRNFVASRQDWYPSNFVEKLRNQA
jgi:hypothetical protein